MQRAKRESEEEGHVTAGLINKFPPGFEKRIIYDIIVQLYSLDGVNEKLREWIIE